MCVCGGVGGGAVVAMDCYEGNSVVRVISIVIYWLTGHKKTSFSIVRVVCCEVGLLYLGVLSGLLYLGVLRGLLHLGVLKGLLYLGVLSCLLYLYYGVCCIWGY